MHQAYTLIELWKVQTWSPMKYMFGFGFEKMLFGY